MHPLPPPPESYAVAVLDLLGYKSHLWDNTGAPKPNGLTSLYETCFLWLHAADYGRSFSGFGLTNEGRLLPINEIVNYIIASDTMMLWATKAQAQFLVAAVARIFIRALGWGAPLRGALGYGDCILDLDRRILIGFPIVEALDAEKRQDWIGVCVLPDAVDALEGVTGIVRYDVPLKPQCSNSLPALRHALAWHWAQEVPNAAEIYLTRLAGFAPAVNRVKYDNALTFIRSVDQLTGRGDR